MEKTPICTRLAPREQVRAGLAELRLRSAQAQMAYGRPAWLVNEWGLLWLSVGGCRSLAASWWVGRPRRRLEGLGPAGSRITAVSAVGATANPQERRHYSDHRPYPDPPAELGELTGPVTGVIELPLHLAWGPKAHYDLGTDAGRRIAYETVLVEAISTEELCSYVNGTVLVHVWPRLWLPQRVRQSWEGRFSALRPVA